MAIPDLHSAPQSIRRCVVFGGERCNATDIETVTKLLEAPAADFFDSSEWFAGPAQEADLVIPIIVLDATEGIGDQDRFYARLLRFLDLKNPVVIVCNLDLIGFEQDQFELIEEEYRDLLAGANLTPSYFCPLPIGRPDLIPWWHDWDLAPIPMVSAPPSTVPFRMKVTVSSSNDGVWTVTGIILSGAVHVGDEVLSSPSNLIGVVRSVSQTDDRRDQLTFDTPHFVEPGEVLSHTDAAPVETDVFRVKARWFGEPRASGDPVNVETAYGTTRATIQSVDHILYEDTYKVSPDASLIDGGLVDIIVRAEQVLAIDHTAGLSEAAGVKLMSADPGAAVLATGFLSMQGYADQRNLLTPKALNTTPIQFSVSESARSERNGHEGGVLWFTGLSGSGKSTLAVALEARLFEKGYQVFVLDGDNVRQGLTSNLGFSPDDRSENIRRVGEVAALFRQAGVIVISSFISPYRSDRDRARHAAYSSFHEIYIKAGIETCIGRDPKGLYERAMRGDIPDFTGISAPYEAPTTPELVIDTEAASIDACVEQLVNYVDRNFRV